MMSVTGIERRLRAALDASAETVTDPPEWSAAHARRQPEREIKQRRHRAIAPLLAAAAVVLVAAGATVIVHDTGANRTVPGDQRSPTLRRSTPTSATDSVVGQHPLPGPAVSDAQLYAGGRGWVRTDTSLLWTDDFGTSWHDIAPPGLSTQRPLENASVALLPDGHEWVAFPMLTGERTLTLARRTSPTGTWTKTEIPIAPLRPTTPGISAAGSVTFVDDRTGWLMITESVTHEIWGELLHTTDGGATWTIQAGENAIPVVGPYQFLTPQFGYIDANSAIGMRGWWTTRDAGRTWTELQLTIPSARKGDEMTIETPPVLRDGVLQGQVAFFSRDAGRPDGGGLYRSTDLGATWSVELADTSDLAPMAASPDGSTVVKLRVESGPGTNFTWTLSRSTDGGHTFTVTRSVHDYSPDDLTLADADHFWAIEMAGRCDAFKTDCWSVSGLVASDDGGATWQQLKLPSR